MELITGQEQATDAICRDGRTLVISAKTREAIRAGLAMEFELIDRPDLLASSRKMIEALELDHLVNLGFIGEYLLEVNARISTVVYQPDLNMSWLTVKLAMGMITEDELLELQPRVEIGRRVTRYYDQLEYLDHDRDSGRDRPPRDPLLRPARIPRPRPRLGIRARYQFILHHQPSNATGHVEHRTRRGTPPQTEADQPQNQGMGRSTWPSATITPSALNRWACSRSWWGTSRPEAFTTRCQGTSSPPRVIARPTRRVTPGSPIASAIRP